MRREQRAHEVQILSLERQTIGTPSMKHQLDRLERQNRGLSRALEDRAAEIRRLQRDLRHEKIAVDVAWNYAAQLGQRLGAKEKPLDDLIEKSINDAIRKNDAEIAKASRAKATQQQPRTTPAPSPVHKPSSLHTPEPKVSRVVSADQERDEAQTTQQRTIAKDDGWDEGYG